MGDYVFHIITIPLKAEDDWQRAEQILLNAAKTVCAPYLQEAREHMTELASKHSLDTPTAEPRVHIYMPEPERVDLVLRVPIPAMRRGRMEQEIVRHYLLALNELKKSEGKKSGPVSWEAKAS